MHLVAAASRPVSQGWCSFFFFTCRLRIRFTDLGCAARSWGVESSLHQSLKLLSHEFFLLPGLHYPPIFPSIIRCSSWYFSLSNTRPKYWNFRCLTSENTSISLPIINHNNLHSHAKGKISMAEQASHFHKDSSERVLISWLQSQSPLSQNSRTLKKRTCSTSSPATVS